MTDFLTDREARRIVNRAGGFIPSESIFPAKRHPDRGRVELIICKNNPLISFSKPFLASTFTFQTDNMPRRPRSNVRYIPKDDLIAFLSKFGLAPPSPV